MKLNIGIVLFLLATCLVDKFSIKAHADTSASASRVTRASLLKETVANAISRSTISAARATVSDSEVTSNGREVVQNTNGELELNRLFDVDG